MKKLFTLFVVVAFALPLSAQIGINPQAGINFSRLNQDPQGGEFQSRVGWQAGVELHIGKKFYFQPGIFWNHTGSNLVSKDVTVTDFEESVHINSIEVMAQAGFRILDLSIFKIRGHLGPQLAWVTAVKETETLPDIPNGPTGPEAQITKEDFANFIWYGRVGLALQLTIVTLDFGYDFGLSRVFDQESPLLNSVSTPEADVINARNNRFYVNLGVNIGS